MASEYLSALSADEYEDLKRRLLESQAGVCFICQQPLDLALHDTDVDHVDPSAMDGRDDELNFAVTHASCNRSKQASNLRVARVLARFAQIRERCTSEDRGPNLNDILSEYGGAKYPLRLRLEDSKISYSLSEVGDNVVREAALYSDQLSGLKYFFAKLPIEYLHHDDRINPRNIGGSLGKLVEEFDRKYPQLHVSLGWVVSDGGAGEVKVFDGQHKATAQVLLGVHELPVRVFVDPDPDVLLTANAHAGTTLRQVAFDKSVQRRLGSTLFQDRLERYRREHNLTDDALAFSERDLVQYFKGESREMKRYILDSVRDAITHAPENRLKEYIDYAGKSTEKPISYSTVEKTYYSFFIYQNVLETPLNWREDEDANPRDLEIRQIVRLMNLVADEIFVDQFDPVMGTYRMENRVQKGELIPEHHLRAFRLAKEEISYVWLGYVRQIVRASFTMSGKPFDDERLFQYEFAETLWQHIASYLANLKQMPVWVNRELSSTVFGGKQAGDFWQTIFETGRAPAGTQVLPSPINIMDMINGGHAGAMTIVAGAPAGA